MTSEVTPDPHGAISEWVGKDAGPPPPPDGLKLRVEVEQPHGEDCESVKFLTLALTKLDASLWISHHLAGDVQLLARGAQTVGQRRLAARFHRGEELTVTADGPDAEKALEACRAFLNVHRWARRNLYAEHFLRLRPRTAKKLVRRIDRQLLEEGA